MRNIRQYRVDALPTVLSGLRVSSHNHGNFLWQMIMVCLLAQVTAAPDSITSVEDFVTGRNSTGGSPTITNYNHTYLTDSSELSELVDGELESDPVNYTKLDSYMTENVIEAEEKNAFLQHLFNQVVNGPQAEPILHHTNANATDNTKKLGHKFYKAFPGQRSECTFSRDKLVNLINVTSNPMTAAGISNCNFRGDYNSISCEKLITLIQCRIRHFRGGSELDLAKNLTDLRDTVLRLSKYAQSSCIAQIAGGKIDEAFETYKDLNYDSKLSEIIRTVYTEYGGNEKIVNILDFINKLDSCSKFQIAYGELFKAINDWDNISTEILFYFYGEIARHSGCNCSSLLTWKNKLEIQVDKIIVQWSGQFQKGINNQSNPIVDYARKSKLSYVMRSRLLPIFIQEVYNKVSSNTGNIIKFIDGLSYIDQSITCYSALFNRLQSFPEDLKNHQLMLAYRIKKIMEMDDYPNIDQSYKDTCTTIRDSLPGTVRGLIWNGSNCTVRNKERNEYLIASTQTEPHLHYRFVRTRVSGKLKNDSYWSITTEDLAESFTFKNIFYNISLCAADFFNSNERRALYLWMGERKVKESSWKLESTDNASYFRLKNVKYEQYLYSDGSPDMLDNDERRLAARTRMNSDDIMYRESQWVISC